MVLKIRNLFSSKANMQKTGDFQDLEHIDGVSISSINANNEEDDNGDEVLQLAIKTSTGSGENNMEFDEQTMSWKAVGEKAQKEEEELMAGFDSDGSEDDDDDEDWG